MALSHDCAQVERDCMELHRALALAIRRLTNGREYVGAVMPLPGFVTLDLLEILKSDDLIEVLDDTSRPASQSAELLQAWAT